MQPPFPESLSLDQALAAQFVNRPTLRQVLGAEGFRILVKRYPLITQGYPDLDSLDSFTLMHAPDESGFVRFQSLVEHLLEVFLQGAAVAFSDDHHLSLNVPERFRAVQVITAELPLNEVNLRLSTLNEAFDQLLAGLVWQFQQAQVSFWNGSDEDAGIVRVDWMRQMLRAAMLASLEEQGLAEDEKTVVHDLLLGAGTGVQCHDLQISLTHGGIEYPALLPDLLVAAERDERQLVLWCRPSGKVEAFFSLADFANALHDDLAGRYRFEALTWSRRPVQGDAFSHQSRLLLQCLLDRCERLQAWRADTLEQLEAAFQAASSPSVGFVGRPRAKSDLEAVALPDWLVGAPSIQRFEYLLALQEQATRQAASGGHTSLDGIDDLQGYASRRLREQMQADHPHETPYDPEQLHLELAVPDLIVDPQLPAQLKPVRSVTLAQLASTQLAVETLEVITRITDAHGHVVNGWMNPVYANRLMQSVDVGAQYPAYLKQMLEDPVNRPRRMQLFAGEWRATLLFHALKARVEGHLDEGAWDVLAAFCRSSLDFGQYLSLAPLSFRCAPGARATDTVAGMYLFRFEQHSGWVLYRPFYERQPIESFTDLAALMARISEAGELQQSVLDWLDDEVRAVYDEGGFVRPHLHDKLDAILHLLSPGTSGLAYALDSLRQPVQAAPTFWLTDLDVQMYVAKSRALEILASRQTVSNAQRRWAIMRQVGGLLFNLVAPILPGPVAAVAWLAAVVYSLPENLRTLREGDDAQKSLALSDLLGNLAMLLVHGLVGRATQGAGMAQGEAQRVVDGFPRRDALWDEAGELKRGVQDAVPTRETTHRPATDRDERALQAFAWSALRFNVLTPELKTLLEPFRSAVMLEGQPRRQDWPLRGLVEVSGRDYLVIDGHPYEVRVGWGSARIVAPDGSEGPWLSAGEQGWQLNLRLLGGSGRRQAAVPPGVARSRYLPQAQALALKMIALQTELTAQTQRRKTLVDRVGKDAARLEALRNAVPADEAAHEVDIKRLEKSVEIARALVMAEGLKEELLRWDAVQAAEALVTLVDKAQKGVPFPDPQGRRNSALTIVIEQGLLLLERLAYLRDMKAFEKNSKRLFDPRNDLFAEWPGNQALLRKVLEREKLMLQVFELLDRRITELPDGLLLRFEDQRLPRQGLIAQRRRTFVEYRFHVAAGTVNLALDIRSATSIEQVRQVMRQLAGKRLQDAVTAHRELLMSDMPAEARLEILQNAWREYGNAIIKADVLLHRDTVTYDPALIEEYKQHMGLLKRALEQPLLQAQAEVESEGAQPRAAPRAYPLSPGKHAVRTQEGVLVVATEQQADGQHVLQVRDAFTNMLLHAFHADATGSWVETQEAPQPVPEAEPPKAMDVVQQAQQRVLADSERIEAMATRYVEQDALPATLIDLVEEHLRALREVKAQAEQAGVDPQQLEARITQYEANRTQWLTTLYSKTAYPEAEALAFLSERRLLRIAYTGRKVIANGTAMDEYTIRLLAGADGKGAGKPLWVAHFHFAHQADVPTAFTRGHLKTAAQSKAVGLGVHYGRLTYPQVASIIPFDE